MTGAGWTSTAPIPSSKMHFKSTTAVSGLVYSLEVSAETLFAADSVFWRNEPNRAKEDKMFDVDAFWSEARRHPAAVESKSEWYISSAEGTRAEPIMLLSSELSWRPLA